MEWPYNTLCLPFKKLGEECQDDMDCEMEGKCWYPTSNHVVNRTMQCMKAYALDDGTSIGYLNTFHPDLEHQNYLAAGKVCKSMFATPSGSNGGKCASFGSSNSKDCSVF